MVDGISTQRGKSVAMSYAASLGLEIRGSKEFVTDAWALVLEYRDVFSSELSTEPADLPPLDVPIETRDVHAINRWKDNRR